MSNLRLNEKLLVTQGQMCGKLIHSVIMELLVQLLLKCVLVSPKSRKQTSLYSIYLLYYSKLCLITFETNRNYKKQRDKNICTVCISHENVLNYENNVTEQNIMRS